MRQFCACARVWASVFRRRVFGEVEVLLELRFPSLLSSKSRMRFMIHVLVFLWLEPGEDGDAGSLSGGGCAVFLFIAVGGSVGVVCSGEVQGVVGGCPSACSASSVALAWFVQRSFIDTRPGGVCG